MSFEYQQHVKDTCCRTEVVAKMCCEYLLKLDATADFATVCFGAGHFSAANYNDQHVVVVGTTLI